MSLEIERRVLDEIFASSEAYENLQVLADDIGPRLAGTPNEARARDVLAETLNRYGLSSVRTEAFPHSAWTPVHEMLAIMEPVTRDLSCRCAGLSPSTPGAGAEAEAVLLESGDRREFQERASEVAGRFVLAPYYPVPRQVKTPLAAAHGAVALIETRNAPGALQPARTCAFGQKADIPVASISLEDAEYIRRLDARKGPVRLRLTLDSRTEVKDSWNVVGEIPGTREGPEQIVIGGHYDSWHVGPGAVDNASGVVAVLEAARGLVAAGAELGRTVKVVLFGVEESGLVGSWAYTHQHEGELDHTVLMINNDVGGRPSGISISGIEELEPALAPIAGRVRIAGEDLPPFRVAVGGPAWGSDHYPFAAHGVPTVGIATASVRPEDRAYGHTRADTTDKVYVQGLTECAAINAQIILTVAGLAQRPARRRSREEVQALFVDHDLMDSLDLLGMWPPEQVRDRYFGSL